MGKIGQNQQTNLEANERTTTAVITAAASAFTTCVKFLKIRINTS